MGGRDLSARRPTWAEINLDALAANFRAVRALVSPGVKIMAVVKADAYGHGCVEVSRAAVEGGADSLAVVTVEEGAELRRAGLTVPILVFTDLPPEALPLAAQHRLAVTAHSIPSARRMVASLDLEVH
ncbi:MAG: alanine racemase, partial [Pyrinomonadaceae bacterium]